MAKGKRPSQGATRQANSDRRNGKANKKRPKVFDPAKRRLVTV